MRISDWSSDVCSSDLAIGMTFDELVERAYDRGVFDRGNSNAGSVRVAGQTPIGRASCRERVCQYVEISVVAVSLKKKENLLNCNDNDIFDDASEVSMNYHN